MKALVVIPIYCEASNLPELLFRVFNAQPQVHVLFVDDGSNDGGPNFLKQQKLFDQQIFLLERGVKMGLGSAYVAGFKWALARDYDVIFEMDGDLSHDPKEIPNFLQQIETGADLVIASRYIKGVRVLNWPISRLLISLGAANYVRIVTGMPFTDPTGGYKCFRRALLEKMNLDQVRSNGYSFQIELTHWAWHRNFRIVEIPIVFEERRAGTSKMSWAIAREAFWMVIRLGIKGRFRKHVS